MQLSQEQELSLRDQIEILTDMLTEATKIIAELRQVSIPDSNGIRSQIQYFVEQSRQEILKSRGELEEPASQSSQEAADGCST
jgi:hypothetical protein